MSKKISQLPEYIGTPQPVGDIPISIDGITYKITPTLISNLANYVKYLGATSDVNLGEFGIQLGNLEFDNTPTNIPTSVGSMYYNDTDGTLDLILKGGNVKLQIGQESVIRVVNKTATNITLLEANYQAVRITGAQGQRMKVDLAQATTDGLSAETIGLVTETIANNQEGFVTTSGLVRNINTTGSLQSETWADGDVLYLSPTVAGRITKVKPTAPNHLIIIGYVVYAHATQGTIFVKVNNGYELDELHNVNITSEANEDFLQYESSTQLWKNVQLTFALIISKLGFTPYNATNPSGYQTASQVQTIADAKIVQTIINGVTTTAPSQDAVFDALALKANDNAVVHVTGAETIAGVKTFSSSPIAPTSATGTNTTELATTQFVTNAINSATPGTGYTVYNILITASANITTQTTGTSGGVSYVQNGRNIMINNGATAIEINPASAVDGFIASYTKVGTADVTFSALTTPLAYINALNGRVLSGLPGSTALLVKNGNNYYLSINNVVAT